MAPLVQIDQLSVNYGAVPILRALDLSLDAGETRALVGGSGSGKTTLLRAILGLLPDGAQARGSIRWQGGENLLTAPPRQRRVLRGREIGLIPQEPASALDPRRTALADLRESLRRRGRLARRVAEEQAAGWLREVGLPPERAREHPHQWSGGMQQRLLTAMALAPGPRLLLADEPTAALDPLHQRQLLDLLRRLRRERTMTLLFVTHDLALAAELATSVSVLHAGEVVETALAPRLWTEPRAAATRALIAAQPRWSAVRA